MPEQQCPLYEIGSTVVTMRDVTWYGIPYVVTPTYQPYSIVRKCGNSDEKGYGYPSATWHWDSLSQDQLYAILAFFDNDTDATADVYIRTYKDTGSLREDAVFLVKMYRPTDGNGKTPVRAARFWYTAVDVRFGHMVEQ